MAMVLGYGPPTTDLPGALARGMELGQRSEQIKNQAKQAALEADLQKDAEERLKKESEWRMNAEFEQHVQEVSSALAAQKAGQRIDLLGQLEGLPSTVGLVIDEYQKSLNESVGVPGKKEVIKLKFDNDLTDFIYTKSQQLYQMGSEHTKDTLGLETIEKRLVEEGQKIYEAKQNELTRKVDTQIIQDIESYMNIYKKDYDGLQVIADELIASDNPIEQAKGKILKSIKRTAFGERGSNSSKYDNLTPEQLERVNELQFGKDVPNIAKTYEELWDMADKFRIAHEAADVADEDSDAVKDMRNFSGDQEMPLTTENYYNYLKSVLANGDPLEQVKMKRNYVLYGKLPEPSGRSKAKTRSYYPGGVEFPIANKVASVKEGSSNEKEKKIIVSQVLYDNIIAAQKAIDNGTNPDAVYNRMIEKFTEPNDIEIIKKALGVK